MTVHARPKRTGASGLDDDLLLLLDFLFAYRSASGLMRRDAYPVHANTKYTHRFDDDELEHRLDGLVREGILTTEPSEVEDEGLVYGLTPRGGALWESERCPDWSRFLEDSCGESDGRWLLEVRSSRPDIGEQFLAAAQRFHLWGDPLGPVVRHAVMNDREWLSWRVFSRTYVLTVEVDTKHGGRLIDWSGYHRERRWWRDLRELETLVSPSISATAEQRHDSR